MDDTELCSRHTDLNRNLLSVLSAGIEPAVSRLRIWRHNQLDHDSMCRFFTELRLLRSQYLHEFPRRHHFVLCAGTDPALSRVKTWRVIQSTNRACEAEVWGQVFQPSPEQPRRSTRTEPLLLRPVERIRTVPICLEGRDAKPLTPLLDVAEG